MRLFPSAFVENRAYILRVHGIEGSYENIYIYGSVIPTHTHTHIFLPKKKKRKKKYVIILLVIRLKSLYVCPES